MAEYADLDTIHNPAPGAAAPAAWGDQVRENFERLAKPYRAKVRRTTTQSIPHVTATPISWSSGPADLNLWVFTSPTVFTFPIAGWWTLKLGATFAANASGTRMFWWQYGTRVLGIERKPATPGGWPSSATVEAEEEFLAGDTVSAWVFQDSGAALNLDPSSDEIWAAVRLVRR